MLEPFSDQPDMLLEFLQFSAIALLAFFLKGITGTGTTTVIVSLSVLLIPPKETIVLASLINIFGGLAMVRVGEARLPLTFWIPIALFMFLGSVLGAYSLSKIPTESFTLILGFSFFAVGLWFLFRPNIRAEYKDEKITRADLLDNTVGLFSGFCGGFIGINAPPLVAYFGTYLSKSYLRRLLVLIFIPAAMAQTATFAATGLLSEETLFRGLFMLPAMVLGIYLGNRVHVTVSERVFRMVLGILLIAISSKLLFG